MPFAKRPVRCYGGYNREVLTHLYWSELTRPEAVKAAYLRASASVAAIALLPVGVHVVGERSHEIPQSKQQESLTAKAAQHYTHASLSDKFRMSFISPDWEVSQHAKEGGEGILGSDGNFKHAIVRVGRSCLRGTAYDTTPYKGAAHTVAALNVSGDTLSVYPAGSNGEPLIFDVRPNGRLHPDVDTNETLKAENCHYLGGIPVREAFVDDPGTLDGYSLKYAGPLNLAR